MSETENPTPRSLLASATPPTAAAREAELPDIDTYEGVKEWMRCFFNGADQPSADDLIEQFEKVLRAKMSDRPDVVRDAWDAGFDFGRRIGAGDAASIRATEREAAGERVAKLRKEHDGQHEADIILTHLWNAAISAAVSAITNATEGTEKERDLADYRETQAMSGRTTKAFLATLRTDAERDPQPARFSGEPADAE